MPLTTPPDVDALPTAPSANSPSTFDGLADAFLGAFSTFRTQLIALATWAHDTAALVLGWATSASASETNAAASAAVALAAANFKGPWSSQVGAAAVPYSVSHLGRFWMLLSNLADVTAKVPGTDAEWQQIGGDLPWTQIDNTDSPYTAAAGERLVVDTSAGAVTVNLPASLVASDKLVIKKRGSNLLTIGRNGHKIEALAEDMTVPPTYIAFNLEYIDATVGVIVT